MVNPDDEKLLTQAASAAKYKIWWKDGVCKGGSFKSCFIGDNPWNPLEDSKDAMRLAVEKDVFIENHACFLRHFADAVAAGAHKMDATRKAIVRTVVQVSELQT